MQAEYHVSDAGRIAHENALVDFIRLRKSQATWKVLFLNFNK